MSAWWWHPLAGLAAILIVVAGCWVARKTGRTEGAALAVTAGVALVLSLAIGPGVGLPGWLGVLVVAVAVGFVPSICMASRGRKARINDGQR